MDAWERKIEAEQRRKALRERAIEHLGGRCQICGYDTCMAAMDFHHLDPHTKDFNISAKMTSWGRIEAELKKVELLCCRCHREVHAGNHSGHIEHGEWDRGGHDLDDDPLPEV